MVTTGPLGHLLDTVIRCFRVIRVGIIIADKCSIMNGRYLRVGFESPKGLLFTERIDSAGKLFANVAFDKRL